MTIIISETPATPLNILKYIERKNSKRDLATAIRGINNILLNFPEVPPTEKLERIGAIIDLTMV